jgi:sulfoxide reductase heme-binding subunit YedZ
VLLALPGVYWTYGYWQGTRFYGEYLHATGELAAQLLIATLAVTPLRLMFPSTAAARWLLPRRRYLGVATFGYTLLHAGAYVMRQPVATIVEDAAEIAMWTGWLALILMMALAVTSNDASERLMKRGWKTLHRGVYAVAVLTYAHWVLSAFNPTPGYIHLCVLAALESFRVWRTWMNRRTRQEVRASAT